MSRKSKTKITIIEHHKGVNAVISICHLKDLSIFIPPKHLPQPA